MSLHKAHAKAWESFRPGSFVTVLGQCGAWTVLDRQAHDRGTPRFILRVHILREAADGTITSVWADHRALIAMETA